jgi:hypothetical protein
MRLKVEILILALLLFFFYGSQSILAMPRSLDAFKCIHSSLNGRLTPGNATFLEAAFLFVGGTGEGESRGPLLIRGLIVEWSWHRGEYSALSFGPRHLSLGQILNATFLVYVPRNVTAGKHVYYYVIHYSDEPVYANIYWQSEAFEAIVEPGERVAPSTRHAEFLSFESVQLLVAIGIVALIAAIVLTRRILRPKVPRTHDHCLS